MKRMIAILMIVAIASLCSAVLNMSVSCNPGPNTWTYTVQNLATSTENCTSWDVLVSAPYASISNIVLPTGWGGGKMQFGSKTKIAWAYNGPENQLAPGSTVGGFSFDCPYSNSSAAWTGNGSSGGSDTGTTDGPLPVELSSFTVSFTAGQQAEVCWVTQSETGNMGWNVYRSQTEEFAEAMVLNDAMIGGAGTVSSPTNYSFIDEAQLIEEITYWYWIESIDYSGETTSYDPVQFTVPQDPGQQPEPPVYHNALYQNYPNPFNPSTMIGYSLETQSDVKISIFNQRGEHVKTVMVYNAPEGNNGIEWNGTNEAGNLVSSGIYFYTIEANKFRATRKALLIK